MNAPCPETGRLARITITDSAGSTPRDAGTQMWVWEEGQCGTIGGGRLEFETVHLARQSLAHGRTLERTFALGPALGQCCGGKVTVKIEPLEREEANIKRAANTLWIWGAGHVGRACVNVLAPTERFEITWIDISQERFPENVGEMRGVRPMMALSPETAISFAPNHAAHLIFTHDHERDFKICHAVLQRGFAWCGLIGSETKWARFHKRLRALGYHGSEIARITCPIGLPELGKEPAVIAIGVAQQLLAEYASVTKEEKTLDARQFA